MANIINIETSAASCTVALGIDGEVAELWEDANGANHARRLAPFVESALQTLDRKELKLDAVSVSLGPGSYTGLRIGLSLAKGLCFSKQIPLIGIPTLELLAVKAMFTSMDFDGSELLVPMVDARRMEVYTAVYNFRLNEIMKAQPLVLTPDSYSELAQNNKLIFIGDGSAKAKDFLNVSPQSVWLSAAPPSADKMAIISEKYYREGRFLDLAYSVPIYLKEYEAKHSVNKVLEQIKQ